MKIESTNPSKDRVSIEIKDEDGNKVSLSLDEAQELHFQLQKFLNPKEDQDILEDEDEEDSTCLTDIQKAVLFFVIAILVFISL